MEENRETDELQRKESSNNTKKCKYCQSDIPKKAKICPNCRKKQNKAKGCLTAIIVVIVVFILLIALISLISGGSGADTETIQKAQELSIDDFKSQCKTIPYSDLMRTPDDYKGEYIKLEVQISQVLSSDLHYVCYTKGKDDSKEYGYYGDQFSVYDNRAEKEPKIIEDDFATIYGIYGGTESVTTVFGETKDAPIINLIFIELDK